METFLTIVHWFVALSLIVLVLIQPGSADMGSAFGGGGSSSLMGAGGGEAFKRKLTAGFAVVFFFISFALSYFFKGATGSVISGDDAAKAAEVQKKAAEKPLIPADGKPADGAAPAAEGDKPAEAAAAPASAPAAAEKAADKPAEKAPAAAPAEAPAKK